MNINPEALKKLAYDCAKKDANPAEIALDAVIKALKNPPTTIFHGIRSVVGKTVTKAGDIIDPTKKENVA